jgi:hypothetical protein
MNRKERRRAAKLNRKAAKASNIRHIMHKQNGGELMSFYWGYQADLLTEDLVNNPSKIRTCKGFEFSNATLYQYGMEHEQTVEIGRLIKEASDHQLQVFVEGRTLAEFGQTHEEFLAEERLRLNSAIYYFNQKIADGPVRIKDLLKDIMQACSSISTLVAAGMIEQNEFNGDKFGYGYTNPKNIFEVA